MRGLEAVRNAFTGRYQPSGAWQDADCIVGHAFGLAQSARQGDPGLAKLGLANAALGEYLCRLDQIFRPLPKILQTEVKVAYERFVPIDSQPTFEIAGNRSLGAHLDTREVNAQAATIMSLYGWKTALIVSHAHHIVRVQATLGQMGVETVTPSGLPSVWDPRAEQSEVRSSWRFGLVTIAAVGIYRFHGWM